MRFAIDAHAIGQHLTGNEVYVRSLLRGFADVDRRSEFFAYVSGASAEHSVPERFHVGRVSSNPYFRLGWDLARLVRQDRPDLIHVQYTAPLLESAPVVVTVHDVSFLKHPEFFTFGRRMQLRYTVERTVRTAARVLTVSEFSRQAILGAYPISPEKVRVVPNAANPVFRVINRERAIASVAQRLGFNSPFVFSVGDLRPRKNQIGLIGAFAKLIGSQPHLKHHLVLTGKETWFAPKVREAAIASGVADRIHFTGFVSDSELLDLYNACDCFVFPSFYEGFGLPILEAMACGRAVGCSNVSAIPEVADGAALLFEPSDEDDMCRVMANLLLDAGLRGRKEHLGIQRAAQFNWRKSALATLEVYREVVNERRSAGKSPIGATKRRSGRVAADTPVMAGAHRKP
jgi:glycosyltransferase involved in cell wall biosynthesis